MVRLRRLFKSFNPRSSPAPFKTFYKRIPKHCDVIEADNISRSPPFLLKDDHIRTAQG